MYRLQYADILEDDQTMSRERERHALDRSIALMELAQADAATVTDVANAIAFTNKLWTVLIEDLADTGNGLPKALRAQIISIGIWILRGLEDIRNGKAAGFADVKAVSQSIRDGLL